MAFNNFFPNSEQKYTVRICAGKKTPLISELLVMKTSHFCCLPGDFIFAFIIEVIPTYNPSLNGFQCTWTLLKDRFIAHKNSILHVMNKVDLRNIMWTLS